VRHHPPHATLEDLRRSPVVERTPSWVHVATTTQKRQVLQLVPAIKTHGNIFNRF
jgi:hypothetical protein